MERIRNLILLGILAAIGCSEDGGPTGPEKHPEVTFHGFTNRWEVAGTWWHSGDVSNDGTRAAVSIVPQGVPSYQWQGQGAAVPLPELAPRDTRNVAVADNDSIPPDSLTFAYGEGDNTL